MVERGGIAFKVGRERQRLAAAHDGDAVVAQRAGDQHLVARATPSAAQFHVRRQRSHAARVDEHAVAMATVDHLRIARHQRHARLTGALRHGVADAPKIVDGETLFQNEAHAQVAGCRAARGHIVHRAAHGEPADVAAREEMRRHHEAVRGECQPLARRRRGQHGGIVAAQQLVARIGGEEHVVDNAFHHRTAASVSQHHRAIHNAPCLDSSIQTKV